MRILHVCPYYKPAYNYGGPTNAFASLCEGLSRAGTQVTVYTTNANGSKKLDFPPVETIRNIEGVTVHYFPLFSNGLSYFYSPSLSSALHTRVREFDIVLVASLWDHTLISSSNACVRAKVPFVLYSHGQLFPWALAQKRLKKVLYLKLFGRTHIKDAVAICCTHITEAEAVDKIGLGPTTFVMPHAIISDDFRKGPIGFGLYKQFGIPDHAEILLFVGRLTKIKRPDIAVDVLSAVQSIGCERHLVFIGPDEDRLVPQLRAQAQRSGCETKLHFTGLLNKEAVASALQEGTLLLMPTEVQENFGMSALEAMAAGIPILVSKGIPIGRWAQRFGAGQVAECTKEAFQNAAIELLTNPGQLKEMGRRGEEIVRKYFDVSVISQLMLAHFQAILSTGYPLSDSQYNQI